MTPLHDRVLSSALAAAAAGALAWLLDRRGVDSKVTLTVCLALFGFLEGLVRDARRSSQALTELRSDLRSFFQHVANRDDVRPPWAHLRDLLEKARELSRDGDVRRLMATARSDLERLQDHVSFLALHEAHPDLARLQELHRKLDPR